MAFTCSFTRSARYTRESVSYTTQNIPVGTMRLGNVIFTNTESSEVKVTSFTIRLAVLAKGIHCNAGDYVTGTGDAVTLGVTHSDYTSYISLTDASVDKTTRATSKPQSEGGGYPTDLSSNYDFTVKFASPLVIPAGATYTYGLGKRYNSATESNTLVTTSSGTLSCSWSSKTPGSPKPSKPDDQTVPYNSSFTVLVPSDATGLRYYSKGETEWSHSSTSKVTLTATSSAYYFQSYKTDASYETPTGYSGTATVSVKLNTPSISISPSVVTANTTTPDEYLDDSVIQKSGAFSAVSAIVSVNNGTNPSGCTQNIQYTFPDDETTTWYNMKWDDGLGTDRRPFINKYDDYGNSTGHRVKWKVWLTKDGYLSSNESVEGFSPQIIYAPQGMESNFSTRFYVDSNLITSSTVVTPGSHLGVGWTDYPLTLAKGNFSYYKIDLVPQDGGSARTTGYKRNDPSSSQVDSSRDTIYIDPDNFTDFAGKKYKLRLTPSYYYKRPGTYYNKNLAEGYHDSTNIFESTEFLIGGYPDTPKMIYPVSDTGTSVTYNDSPQLIFQVSSSYGASITDIAIRIASTTYKYSNATHRDMFSSNQWTDGKPDEIESGTIVAFKLPAVASSRSISIDVTNSYGLTCIEPAKFTLNYVKVDYVKPDEIVKRVISSDDLNDLFNSYSKFTSIIPTLYYDDYVRLGNTGNVLYSGVKGTLYCCKLLRQNIVHTIPDGTTDTLKLIDSYLSNAGTVKQDKLVAMSDPTATNFITAGNTFNYVLHVLKTML